MAINVTWGDSEKTHVYMRVTGKWSWQEYRECIASANELIGSVDYPVSIITHLVDMDAQRLPPGAFSQWQKSLKTTPHNLQFVILVPGRYIIRMFLDTIVRLFGGIITFKFRMASTYEAAIEIIKQPEEFHDSK